MCYKKLENPPENHRKPWTEAHMVTVVKLRAKGLKYVSIASILGRTTSAITTRACILRVVVRMNHRVTDLQPGVKQTLATMADYNAVVELSKALLKGADICMKDQALIQPFLSIVTKHAKIIGKLNLFEE